MSSFRLGAFALMLSLLLVSALTGCAGGSGSTSTTVVSASSSAPSSTSGTTLPVGTSTFVAGRVKGNGFIAGATVTLLDPSTGAAIASTTTDRSGGFYFVGRPLPTTFVVDASTSVSDPATDHGHLRREVAGGQMTSLWVTPATHLAWVYHKAHPELDVTQAATR